MSDTHFPLLRIGITMGDPNGVGPELLQQMFQRSELLSLATFIVFGQEAAFSAYNRGDSKYRVQLHTLAAAKEARPGRVNFVACGLADFRPQSGQCTPEGAAAAVASLQRAGEELKAGNLDAVVTGPIDKKHLSDAGFPFPGQTEFFAELAGAKGLMFMVHEDLKVAVATGHISLAEVPSSLTKEMLRQKVQLMAESLRRDFRVVRPKIALLGLNPHAGDDGKFGKEEKELIAPLLDDNRLSNYVLGGPYSADAFFAQAKYRAVDACLAMYHDQGLIPFKTIAGFAGVNYTAGLPFVRTSPDHGPAFDIAGTGTANPESFLAALYQAIDIVRSRKQYSEANKNPLRPLSRELREIQEEGD